MVKKTSMRFKHITKIKNDIMNILDNNQELKRLCCYLTSNPLSERIIIDGKPILQPNINKSILKTNLIPYGFTDNILDITKVYIFCELRTITFGKSNVADNNLFILTIFVPLNFNELEPYGEERIIKIAGIIADELDDINLDKGMSNISIKSNSVCNYGRYSNKDYLVLSIPFEILTSATLDIVNN